MDNIAVLFGILLSRRELNVGKEYDSISLASELGRLDFISALMAIIAIGLAIGAIFSFQHFKGVAKEQARETARIVSEDLTEQLVNDYLQREFPKIVDANIEVFGAGTDDITGSNVAGSQDRGISDTSSKSS